jgi:hypothetical protein
VKFPGSRVEIHRPPDVVSAHQDGRGVRIAMDDFGRTIVAAVTAPGCPAGRKAA